MAALHRASPATADDAMAPFDGDGGAVGEPPGGGRGPSNVSMGGADSQESMGDDVGGGGGGGPGGGGYGYTPGYLGGYEASYGGGFGAGARHAELRQRHLRGRPRRWPNLSRRTRRPPGRMVRPGLR